MKLFEIEIGRSYKCDRKDGQYVATVKENARPEAKGPKPEIHYV
jgi:hypothetical protein